MKSDFVANASHELKTPVSAINLLAESAADAAGTGDTDQAIEFARQIADESERLAHLVRDLLDLSRLEASAATDAVTDMREAISNALLGHRTAAAERSLELAYEDAAGGEDAYAQADPTDIAVALDNLLDNAIKYTEHGAVDVRLSVQGGGVVVSITDTGIGIPADDIPRIFERFYRVDRARSRESGGTGLGLSLVRHVVERSNGSLAVTSQPGEGSTFTMTLPRPR
jgi:signal transduction histidine kinase